jgi:type-F conjugative transfer system pilin assembly protein TrbC
MKKVLLSVSILSMTLSANLYGKPDLQKAYKEGLAYANVQKNQDNTSAPGIETPTIGVCQKTENVENNEPEITPGCLKKKPSKFEAKRKGSIDDVLDEVTKTSHISSTDNTEKILVFVSFSMPKASLEHLLKEAHKYNAVPIMRGLKDDSFKATQIAYLDLGKDLNQGIEINPEAFETYQITQVPVFVKVRGDQEIARIKGNISIDYAVKELQKADL